MSPQESKLTNWNGGLIIFCLSAAAWVLEVLADFLLSVCCATFAVALARIIHKTRTIHAIRLI